MNITVKRSTQGVLLSEAPDGIYVKVESFQYPKDIPVVIIKIGNTVKILEDGMLSSTPPLNAGAITTRWIPVRNLTVEV